MIEFTQWLEERNNIIFTTFYGDGRVVAYINNVRYVYVTDVSDHRKWKYESRFKPGAVLNEIKDLVRRGLATQLEPEPKLPSKTPKSTQKRLF